MDALLKQQRLQHIVDSYSLAGEEGEAFARKLDRLSGCYPWFLVELALVEVLIENWLRFPLPRGLTFLNQVQERLQIWQASGRVCSTLTPDQFEQIAGLTPLGFMGAQRLPIAYAASSCRGVPGGPGDRGYPAD